MCPMYWREVEGTDLCLVWCGGGEGGHVALKQRPGVYGSGALFMLSVPFCRSYLMKVWTSTCHS